MSFACLPLSPPDVYRAGVCLTAEARAVRMRGHSGNNWKLLKLFYFIIIHSAGKVVKSVLSVCNSRKKICSSPKQTDPKNLTVYIAIVVLQVSHDSLQQSEGRDEVAKHVPREVNNAPPAANCFLPCQKKTHRKKRAAI